MKRDAASKEEKPGSLNACKRIVSPSPTDFESLRQPLTEGELEVFNFFDRLLPCDWEIYLQPHLNGLQPDIVLLNPEVGIALFEVKDWDLSRAIYQAPQRRNDGYVVVPSKNGLWKSKPDPLDQVRGYEAELSTIYLPTLGASRENVAALTAGVIFTRANGDQAKKFLSDSLVGKSADFLAHHPVVGRDSINQGDLDTVFPEAKRPSSRIMNKELAEDLRKWLREPEAAREQRTPLKLDSHQRALSSERTESGFRRIRGPAGSGKSVILAQRAANLQREGKEVLVVYFNHTLRPYLWDLTSRAGGDPKRVTWLGFHEWCKRTIKGAGRSVAYSKVWSEDESVSSEREITEILEQVLARETIDALSSGPTAQEVARFDAILVDEGQDFSPEWWEALRLVRREEGEMLLMSDLAQDIYEQGSKWTEDVMKGAGFSGPWKTLKESYRMPEQLTRLVAEFGARFLSGRGGIEPVPVDRQETLPFVRLKWRQVRPGAEVEAAIDEIDQVVENASYSDVGIMTTTRAQAIGIEKALARRGIKCQSTLDEDKRKEREKKVFFFRGDSRIKVTTIHNFKGWEMSRIILLLSRSSGGDAESLAYTGLSRLSISEAGSYLSVVSSVPEFEEFGKLWPSFSTER